MSSSNNNSNQPVVPSAREALNKFKMEAAQEVGVNLNQGYNGNLAGSVGGQMVKKMMPTRTASFSRADRTAVGHCSMVTYRAGLCL